MDYGHPVRPSDVDVRSETPQLQLQELQEWAEALDVIVPQLDRNHVRNELLPLALTRGKVDADVVSRVVACYVFGSACKKLAPEDV